MKSLILIPSYLWKNTFKRWWENPISPFSKVLVTTILSLLAILVLVFFSESRNQLLQRLKSSDSYTYYISEQISPNNSAVRLQQSLNEEQLWLKKFGKDQITYVRQTHQILRWQDKPISTVVYSSSSPELYEQLNEHPQIWLLSTQSKFLKPIEDVYSDSVTISATTRQMPKEMAKHLGIDSAVAIPIEMAESTIASGFYIHLIANLNSIAEVEEFAAISDAYYSAEHIRTRTFSTLGLLQDIDTLNKLQTYIRIGIIATCGIISALIIGTIAWLEYRQESYLLALLRSFGTPRYLLLVHSFFENLILVGLGIISALLAWPQIYNVLIKSIDSVSMRNAAELQLPTLDVIIIVSASTLGVALAMIPVSFGLRKPAGLILQ